MQCLLAGWHSTHTIGRQNEQGIEFCQQGLRRHQTDSCGDQLNGERQTVQLLADGCNSLDIISAKIKVGLYGPGSLNKQYQSCIL